MPPARKAETICSGPSIVPFTVRSLRSQTGRGHLPLPYLLAHLGRMHADVTYLAALIAGLVSFLSPCVLPLVPPYLVFLAGTSLERFADREPEPRVKRETVSAAAPVRSRLLDCLCGAWRERQRDRFAHSRLFGSARHRRRDRHHHHGSAFPRRHADRAPAPRRSGWTSPSLSACGAPMSSGLRLRSAGRRASGPILAAILAVAASEQTVTKGASLLAVYSLGLGIPFVIAAFAIEPFAAFLSRFRNHLHRVEQAMGALLVLDRRSRS